jgi:hypothetical protein
MISAQIQDLLKIKDIAYWFITPFFLAIYYINDNTIMPDTDKMQKQLTSIYDQLRKLRMDQHARDFWRIRAGKQQQQVLQDPLLHEHTAVTQYIQWHNHVGARLPSFMRGTVNVLPKMFQTIPKL